MLVAAAGAARGTRLGRAHFDPGAAGPTLLSLPLTAAARRLLADGDLIATRLEGVGIGAGRVKLRAPAPHD